MIFRMATVYGGGGGGRWERKLKFLALLVW